MMHGVKLIIFVRIWCNEKSFSKLFINVLIIYFNEIKINT